MKQNFENFPSQGIGRYFPKYLDLQIASAARLMIWSFLRGLALRMGFTLALCVKRWSLYECIYVCFEHFPICVEKKWL